jgi:fatty acid desaturase
LSAEACAVDASGAAAGARPAPRSALSAVAVGYTLAGYAGGFALMASSRAVFNALGVLLCTHAMLIAAYLVHEAAHGSLVPARRTRTGERRSAHARNRAIGELMSFVAGGSYASFERIRELHLCHHRERCDVGRFDYKRFLRARRGGLRRVVYALEWAYLPAVELLMHAQVIVRPFVERSQRRYLPRVLAMLLVRGGLLAALAWQSPRALLLYVVAYGLLMVVLNFFDAFHHTYEQFFVGEGPFSHEARPDRAYERANTYSNLVSERHPWLNLLTLNFGYHNAHHERPGEPWYRLPALHQQLFAERPRELMPMRELLRTFHRNRLRRILDDDYGSVGTGPGRADGFVGAHGVSFLSVV